MKLPRPELNAQPAPAAGGRGEEEGEGGDDGGDEEDDEWCASTGYLLQRSPPNRIYHIYIHLMYITQ
jgi:hypothetical protein